MANLTKTSLVKSIYSLLCTVGLIAHITYITIGYLKYETVTSVFIQFPVIVPSPALSVCFRYTELLDSKWLLEVYGQKLGFNATSGVTLNQFWEIRQNIRLNDVFERTPPGDKCCNTCMVRNDINYGITEIYNMSRVMQQFEISRYYAQETICYRTQLRANQVYNYSQLATSQGFGAIFSIGFSNLSFNRTSYLVPIVHQMNEYPITSFYFSPITHYASNSDLNGFAVSNQKIETHFLKHPYKPNCIDYNGRRTELIQQCVTKLTINRFDVYPYSRMQYESNIDNRKLKMAHPSNIIGNRTLLDGFTDIRDHCRLKYKNVECYQYFYMTFIHTRWSQPDIDSITFNVMQPKRPTFRTVYQPMEDFYTFSLLILSCFGVWLGLSFADFNPISLKSYITGTRSNDHRQMNDHVKIRRLELEVNQLKSVLGLVLGPSSRR